MDKMKRMAKIIITFMIGIYLLQYLPSLMSLISRKVSDGINSITQMAHDTLNETIEDVKNWDFGDELKQIASDSETAEDNGTQNKSSEQITDISRIKDAQDKLNQIGYNAGKIDGVWGPKTKAALNLYQSANGMKQTDYLDLRTYQSLIGLVDKEIADIDETDSSTCDHSHLTCKYSKHPHQVLESVKCTVCNARLYPTRETGTTISPMVTARISELMSEHKTHVVTQCTLCFPTGNKESDTNSGVIAKTDGWQRNVIVGSQAYANLSELSYATDEYADGNHKKVSILPNQYRLDSGDDFNQVTDALIQTDISEEGTLIVSIAFEGSSGGDPIWGLKTFWDFLLNKIDSDTAKHNIYESAHDWWFTDYFCGATVEGIHKGFDAAINQFNSQMKGKYVIPISNEYLDIAMLDAKQADAYYSYTTLASIVNYAKNNPGKMKFRITGHSLGGAEAQVYTYRLLEAGVDKKDLYTYTYASPVPFTSEAIIDSFYADVNVFNFINVRDFVPKYGVTLADHWFGSFVNTVGSEAGNAILMALYQSKINTEAMPGGFVLGGGNLGYNVYVEGKSGNNIGAEHDFGTYLNLFSRDDTSYKIIYTRPTIQKMNQSKNPYQLIGIYLDAMGLDMDDGSVIYGYLEGVFEQGIKDLVGDKIEEIAKIRFEFDCYEWTQIPIYTSSYAGDKLPDDYIWERSPKESHHTVYAEEMALDKVKRDTVVANDNSEVDIVGVHDKNNRIFYMEYKEYVSIYYMCMMGEPTFNTVRLDNK